MHLALAQFEIDAVERDRWAKGFMRSCDNLRAIIFSHEIYTDLFTDFVRGCRRVAGQVLRSSVHLIR